MRHLILSADYLRPSLRDEDSSTESDPWQELSPTLAAEILEWNDRYQVVVPMDMPARVTAAGLIDQLDRDGVDLAARIQDDLNPAKVRYYSEGLMRYLP